MPMSTMAQLNVSGMDFRPNENHIDIAKIAVAVAAKRSACHLARMRKKHHSPPMTTIKLMHLECQCW